MAVPVSWQNGSSKSEGARHELVARRGLGIVEDVRDQLLVRGPEEEVDVPERLPREQRQAGGRHPQKLLVIGPDGANVLAGEKAVAGAGAADLEQVLVLELHVRPPMQRERTIPGPE